MAVVLQAADIERVLIDKLRATFPGISFGRVAPPAMPARLVTLSRLGGPELNPLIDQAHIDIMVYAPTDAEATNLALRVQAVLSAMNEGPVCKASVSGPSSIAGSTPRRYMYADVRIVRSAATI